MKTFLQVPMEDKDRAKRLGAQWDPARRLWFVPDGSDLTAFLAWVPGLPTLTPEVKRVLGSRT